MKYNYKNIKWSDKDQREVDEIVEDIKYYSKWFFIGILLGLLIVVVFSLISKIIDYNGLFKQIGVFLRWTQITKETLQKKSS